MLNGHCTECLVESLILLRLHISHCRDWLDLFYSLVFSSHLLLVDQVLLVPLVPMVDVFCESCKRSPFMLIFYRSEEHTSELQSRENLVCRLLLEKKK